MTRRYEFACYSLCMVIGFALGGSRGLVSILPFETYYYMPQVMFGVAALTMAGFLWGRPKERKEVTAQSVSLFFLAFCLSCSWTSIVQNAIWTRWLLAGILPTNDAKDFLDSALTLLGSGSFETPRGRPLSEAAWAGALALFHLDLSNAIYLLTALIALALGTACLASRPLIGTALAILLSACLFDYIHDHIGGVTSEIQGFILGLGAFALMTYAAKARGRVAFVFGFGFISVAMVYRVGAMFILPALLFWAFRHLRERNGRPWLTLVFAAGFLMTVFAVNGAVTNRITPTSGGNFVNAIDSWYATLVEGDLALGRRGPETVLHGTRWVQIYEDFPELKTPQGQGWTARKKEVFVRSLRERPLSAVVGGLLEMRKYLFKTYMLDFIDFKPLRYLLMFFWYLGLLVCIRQRRDPGPDMMLWANLGILASQPFLYGGEYRAPAPTVAFTLMLAIYGIKAVIGLFLEQKRSFGMSAGWPAAWTSLAAGMVILLSALGVAQRGKWIEPVGPSYSSQTPVAAFSLPKGSGLVISSERDQFPYAQDPHRFEENLLRQQSHLGMKHFFRRVDYDDPLGPKSSWFLRRISGNSTPFFAGLLLDRFTGKPAYVLISNPKPHAAVKVYDILGRDEGALVVGADSG